MLIEPGGLSFSRTLFLDDRANSSNRSADVATSRQRRETLSFRDSHADAVADLDAVTGLPELQTAG
jgi:hypothetical protein